MPGTGLLAACVPAAFGTWMLLLERYGTMRLRQVMEYAIGYAEHGYPMLATASAAIASVATTFAEHWPGSAEIYLASGVPAPGSRFTNKPLAAIYRRIRTEAEQAAAGREEQIEAARNAFYQGFVAEAIARYLDSAEVMDVTGGRHRGLLNGSDLASWRASVESPVTFNFRGLTVCKTGPWGQGPVFLQQLALLDGLGIEQLRPGSADFIHVVTEAAKLAFADREAWYGDPRQSAVPLAELLSADYAEGPAGPCRRNRLGRTAAGIAGRRRSPPAGLCCLAAGMPATVAGAATGEPTAIGDRRRPVSARTRPRRYLPSGYHRPVRQHGLGHAERRLAAEFPCHPRPGLLPGHQSADVHPHAGPGQHARARPQAQDHAVTKPGAARWASPTWRSARPAATSRISGRWPSS